MLDGSRVLKGQVRLGKRDALRRRWLSRLDHGVDRQGRYVLAERIDGLWHYCLLGLACEVYSQTVRPLEVETVRRLRYYEGESCNLPGEVYSAFDFRCPEQWLMILNDRRGLSFSQMARVIRGSYSKVFF